MIHARVYHTLTMLADGTVLAVGGEPTWGQTGSTETTGGMLPSEIWNPDTQTWSPCAPIAATRDYHSTAILMPDGTVLVAGGGHANPGYPGPELVADLLAAVPVQRPPADDRLGARRGHLRFDDHGHDAGRGVDQRGQPRLARRRHPPVRHGSALRAAQLHARPPAR